MALLAPNWGNLWPKSCILFHSLFLNCPWWTLLTTKQRNGRKCLWLQVHAWPAAWEETPFPDTTLSTASTTTSELMCCLKRQMHEKWKISEVIYAFFSCFLLQWILWAAFIFVQADCPASDRQGEEHLQVSKVALNNSKINHSGKPGVQTGSLKLLSCKIIHYSIKVKKHLGLSFM